MPYHVQVGALKHRVVLEESTRVADGQGGYAVTWAEVGGAGAATLWARIRPLSGKEQVAHQQLQNTLTHEVVIRYRPGVTGAMRFTRGARVFNIRGIPRNIDENNEWLVLDCEEGVAT